MSEYQPKQLGSFFLSFLDLVCCIQLLDNLLKETHVRREGLEDCRKKGFPSLDILIPEDPQEGVLGVPREGDRGCLGGGRVVPTECLRALLLVVAINENALHAVFREGL